MGKDETNNKHQPLQIERSFTLHNQSMLAALRVVLDLPRKPISFKDDQHVAIISEQSDVYPDRTDPKGSGQEE